MFFVTGVSGVGKTTTLKELKLLLPAESFDIRDFDERGVPDGGGPMWHNNETIYWLDIATENAMKGKSTIVCGFNEPERVRAVHTEAHVHVELILLHASADTIRKRLRGRYPTVESEKEIERASGMPLGKFIDNCIAHAPTMKRAFEHEHCYVVETDDKSPKTVAVEVATVIMRA